MPLPFVALASQKSGMVLHFLCFYGHPTLRDWFISEWSTWERATSTDRNAGKAGAGLSKPRGRGERVGRRTNQYKKSGKNLDMGKGCVRFKSPEDLALDVVGRTVGHVFVEEHMANYQAVRALLGKAVTRVKLDLSSDHALESVLPIDGCRSMGASVFCLKKWLNDPKIWSMPAMKNRQRYR